MTDLEILPQHLQTISKKDWEKLFSLLGEIERTENFGEVRSEKISENISTFPVWVSSDVVDKFSHIVHELGIVPVFDWTNWEEGKAILNNSKQDYNQLDVITLCKLFTTIIRADRFSDGLLVENFENGIIPKIITSLQLKMTNGEK